MRRPCAFRTTAAYLIATTALLSTLVVQPILGAVLTDSGPKILTEEKHTETLPGLSYCLAEIECRQWHRNRANRPFAFALKQ
jgi:hypothetical protein